MADETFSLEGLEPIEMPSSPGWERQRRPSAGEPFIWIQWKGSDICGDFTCSCGAGWHIDDGTFMYYVRCPDCGAIFMANGHIEIVPLTPEESARVINEGHALVEPRD